MFLKMSETHRRTIPNNNHTNLSTLHTTERYCTFVGEVTFEKLFRLMLLKPTLDCVRQLIFERI